MPRDSVRNFPVRRLSRQQDLWPSAGCHLRPASVAPSSLALRRPTATTARIPEGPLGFSQQTTTGWQSRTAALDFEWDQLSSARTRGASGSAPADWFQTLGV